jgi:hypothetical protein
MNTKTISQFTKWLSWFWDLEKIWSFEMCLGVNVIALVLNENFRKLGYQWMWRLGVFIALNHFLAVDKVCWRWTHRTVVVHCPVRATSARPLGFGASWPLEMLSFCCTGQSGATPDSPVPHRTVRWSLTSALWLLRGTVCYYRLLQSTVGAQGAVAPLAHRTVRCTPDSPMNYSEASPLNSREWPVRWVLAWCTGLCPVCHLATHSQVLL